MNNLIIITKDNNYKFNDYKDLFKFFLGDDYFTLTEDAKKERIKNKAYSNSFGEIYKIVNINDVYDKNKPYILIDNEINYILSIIKIFNILIMENRNSNVFVNDFMRKETLDNYFIINNYIDKILYGKW